MVTVQWQKGGCKKVFKKRNGEQSSQQPTKPEIMLGLASAVRSTINLYGPEIMLGQASAARSTMHQPLWAIAPLCNASADYRPTRHCPTRHHHNGPLPHCALPQQTITQPVVTASLTGITPIRCHLNRKPSVWLLSLGIHFTFSSVVQKSRTKLKWANC